MLHGAQNGKRKSAVIEIFAIKMQGEMPWIELRNVGGYVEPG